MVVAPQERRRLAVAARRGIETHRLADGTTRLPLVVVRIHHLAVVTRLLVALGTHHHRVGHRVVGTHRLDVVVRLLVAMTVHLHVAEMTLRLAAALRLPVVHRVAEIHLLAVAPRLLVVEVHHLVVAARLLDVGRPTRRLHAAAMALGPLHLVAVHHPLVVVRRRVVAIARRLAAGMTVHHVSATIVPHAVVQTRESVVAEAARARRLAATVTRGTATARVHVRRLRAAGVTGATQARHRRGVAEWIVVDLRRVAE